MKVYTAALSNDIEIICEGMTVAAAIVDATQQAAGIGQTFLGTVELLDCSIG